MKKVLITGGVGLVGSHIANQLVKQSVSEMMILDNSVKGTKANLEWEITNENFKII